MQLQSRNLSLKGFLKGFMHVTLESLNVPFSTPCCPSAGPGLTRSAANGSQNGPWLARWDVGVDATTLKHISLPSQIFLRIPPWDMFPITPYEYIHAFMVYNGPLPLYHYLCTILPLPFITIYYNN